MAIANNLHMLFEARREAFKIVGGQPAYAYIHCIIEELVMLLYPIQFDKEWGNITSSAS